jgi:hypothetical protein
MSATSTILGNAFTFGYNLASTGSFVLLTQIKAATLPKPEYAVVDVSSVSDVAAIKLPGFVDNKSFSVDFIHTISNMTALTLTLPGILAYYQFTLADASTFTCQAILKTPAAPKLDRNGELVWNCEFDVSGVIAYVSG